MSKDNMVKTFSSLRLLDKIGAIFIALFIVSFILAVGYTDILALYKDLY